MLRKIFKTGDDTVVPLPKDVLDYFHLQEGSEVSVELDRERGGILIQPSQRPLSLTGIDEAFARQVEAFIEQYRPALEALSRK